MAVFMYSLKTECCPIVRLYHVNIPPSHLSGQLNCFHILAVVNRAATNMADEVSGGGF